MFHIVWNGKNIGQKWVLNFSTPPSPQEKKCWSKYPKNGRMEKKWSTMKKIKVVPNVSTGKKSCQMIFWPPPPFFNPLLFGLICFYCNFVFDPTPLKKGGGKQNLIINYKNQSYSKLTEIVRKLVEQFCVCFFTTHSSPKAETEKKCGQKWKISKLFQFTCNG